MFVLSMWHQGATSLCVLPCGRDFELCSHFLTLIDCYSSVIFLTLNVVKYVVK